MNFRSSSELWARGLVARLAVYVMLLVSSGALFAQPVAPVISKSFGAASVPLNGITTLKITIANTGTVTLTGVGFTDNLPSGLAVPSSSSSPCGGTLTVTGGNTITLTGATIAANSTCGVLLTNVQGQTAGTKVNTTSTVSSNEAGAGGAGTATLTVVAPPIISKAFGVTSILANGTTTLTFTFTNPAANTVALTGLALSDDLPGGMVVANPNGLSNTCGGTVTAVPGVPSVTITGTSTVATNSSCTLVVNIVAPPTNGNVINTTTAVQSSNGGTGNTATASMLVGIPPTPAPSSLVLLAMGLLALMSWQGWRMLRRRSQ